MCPKCNKLPNLVTLHATAAAHPNSEIGWHSLEIEKQFSWILSNYKHLLSWGRDGGGQMGSVLAFYSDGPSSNPAESLVFIL